MFRREREREAKVQNSGPFVGQIRVLVVGDSGVGKTSLVHLILKGSSIARPLQTVGCSVSIKHTTYGSSGSSSSSLNADNERDFFVELWDISGHERYKYCRPMLYSQINGVIFVHDLSQRQTKTSLQKWACEIAMNGTFEVPLESGGPGGLPVPYIVIGNKVDIVSKFGMGGSSGNLVDAARQWVEKQGLLPSSEELPLTGSFSPGGGLTAAASEARYDKEAVMKFFRMLIRRRYYTDDLPRAAPWLPPQLTPLPVSTQTHPKVYEGSSPSGDTYKYNGQWPLPAQRNLTPQQTATMPNNYILPRFLYTKPQEMSSSRPER